MGPGVSRTVLHPEPCSGTVLDSLRVSRTVPRANLRPWIRGDYPEPGTTLGPASDQFSEASVVPVESQSAMCNVLKTVLRFPIYAHKTRDDATPRGGNENMTSRTWAAGDDRSKGNNLP
ncbi:hypothetical protein Bbelb_231030 [Branchiostoma belcheri]|nr:hypothetical protein Bbelb_231030 [Branchiostoma belcheri]